MLTAYTDQNIQIEPAKEVGDKNLVSIRVNIMQNGGQAPIKLDFKWRKTVKLANGKLMTWLLKA